jgi:hypothetical protein
MATFTLEIGPSARLSRVMLDGKDISRSLTGFELSAHVGPAGDGLTRLRLFVVPGESIDVTGQVPSEQVEWVTSDGD